MRLAISFGLFVNKKVCRHEGTITVAGQYVQYLSRAPRIVVRCFPARRDSLMPPPYPSRDGVPKGAFRSLMAWNEFRMYWQESDSKMESNNQPPDSANPQCLAISLSFLPHLLYLFVRKTLLSDPFYLRLFTRRKRRYVEVGKNAGFRQLHVPF